MKVYASLLAIFFVTASLHSDIVETYLKNFETLAKAENWDEIIARGTEALSAAKADGRLKDEAKICAQLTSTAFYKGDYLKALEYAQRCHELSETFDEPQLFLRALYLESAVHRALAGKHSEETTQQESFSKAVKIAEEAACLYKINAVNDRNLQGKIYFNLGAAHADNPKGNLSEASACYAVALSCFNDMQATDDLLRTTIRLGKVHLLQKNYALTEQMIQEARGQVSNERIAMQIDYLEAQLKLAMGDPAAAAGIVQVGLERAKRLGAKEDERRFQNLFKIIGIA
jgi:tetratricopeptide (TPR) repeat protein